MCVCEWGRGPSASPLSNSESQVMAKKLDVQIIIPGMFPLTSAKEGYLGFPDFPKTSKPPKLTKK